MVYSDYTKRRILFHEQRGLGVRDIVHILTVEEGLKVSKSGIYQFLKTYKEHGTLSRKSGSGRPTKVTGNIKKIVDESLEVNDEKTAVELKNILGAKGCHLSVSTVLRCRRSLGWTCRGSAYCQLIREGNKGKRLKWALKYLSEVQGGGFRDVIYTDECSVQLEAHRRRACRRLGQPPRPKPRYNVRIYNSYLLLYNTYVTVYEKVGQLAEIYFCQDGPKYLLTRTRIVFAILPLGTANLMKVSLAT